MSAGGMNFRQNPMRKDKVTASIVAALVALYIIGCGFATVYLSYTCYKLNQELAYYRILVDELENLIDDRRANETPAEQQSAAGGDSGAAFAGDSVVYTVCADDDTEAASAHEGGTVMTVTATAYCPCMKCCGIWSEEHPDREGTGYQQLTSSGAAPIEGRTIATDPSVIPTGSHVLINGHMYVAEDTGGAIKGDHIDIFFDTHQEALGWGRQTLEVTVFEN